MKFEETARGEGHGMRNECHPILISLNHLSARMTIDVRI